MKRWMGRILLCLILGAVTTVAVAWACTLWAVVDVQYLASEPQGSRFGFGYALLGSDEEVYLIGQTFDASTVTAVRFLFEPSQAMSGWPRHCLTRSIYPSDSTARNPFTPRRVAGDREGFETGVAIESWSSVLGSEAGRRLPLVPIWPGFVIDTLFYAAIWFGVFFAPGMAKRAIRRGRGRCPMCGYDLRGHRHQGTEASRHQGIGPGCPECGWNREGIEAPRHRGIKDGAP